MSEQMMKSKEHDVLNGALYAVSSLIRHSENLRTLFYANGRSVRTFITDDDLQSMCRWTECGASDSGMD